MENKKKLIYFFAAAALLFVYAARYLWIAVLPSRCAPLNIILSVSLLLFALLAALIFGKNKKMLRVSLCLLLLTGACELLIQSGIFGNISKKHYVRKFERAYPEKLRTKVVAERPPVYKVEVAEPCKNARLLVFHNGRPLGPNSFRAVDKIGKGAYFWKPGLGYFLFALPDNSYLNGAQSDYYWSFIPYCNSYLVICWLLAFGLIANNLRPERKQTKKHYFQ
jgi:hypothetical protein